MAKFEIRFYSVPINVLVQETEKKNRPLTDREFIELSKLWGNSESFRDYVVTVNATGTNAFMTPYLICIDNKDIPPISMKELQLSLSITKVESILEGKVYEKIYEEM